ncbi:MAG: hypothetical protein FWE53_05165 [Firmicutes bacterium]|nr:hypothetical protein [Bacillota bacterium]
MENRFYHIDEKLALELIARTKTEKAAQWGAWAEVHVFENHAVLGMKGMYYQDKHFFARDVVPYDIIISKLNRLAKKGVAVVPILGYCFRETDGYIIMERAKGSELWAGAIRWDKERTLTFAKDLAEAPQKQFDKFVSDYKAILDMGLTVDWQNIENFFYDSSAGFQFIDVRTFSHAIRHEENITLGCKQNMKAGEYLLPCLEKIQDGFARTMSESEFNTLMKNNKIIFDKAKTAAIKSGASAEMIDDALNSPHIKIAGVNANLKYPDHKAMEA